MLVVEGAQYVLIGGLDLLLVVIAAQELDLGDSGAGVLSTAFGVGAAASVVLASRLSRRSRLAPVLTAGMIVVAASALALGAFLSVADRAPAATPDRVDAVDRRGRLPNAVATVGAAQ